MSFLQFDEAVGQAPMRLYQVAADEFDAAVDVAALADHAADELAHFAVFGGHLERLFAAAQCVF